MRVTGCQLNVLRVFHASFAPEILQGLKWYEEMGNIACQRMRSVNRRRNLGHSLPRSKCLGIIAALSPQKNWSRNVAMAEAILYRDEIGAVGVQKEKGKRILGGEDPADVLKGQKERAFYQCFLDPHKTDAVTIDRHALCIWLGEYRTRDKELVVTPRLYRLASHDYREVARVVGMRPNQLQAITWIAWRRLHGSRGHTMDRNAGL
jgi:hypothetical protein